MQDPPKLGIGSPMCILNRPIKHRSQQTMILDTIVSSCSLFVRKQDSNKVKCTICIDIVKLNTMT